MNTRPNRPQRQVAAPAKAPAKPGHTAPAVRPAAEPALVLAAEPGRARYAQLAQALRERVLRGEWPPGAAMPAEQVLAADHGVALGTMRQALQLLVSQGLVERFHGRGTFVRAGLSGATMLRFFRFGEAVSSQVPASTILRRQRVVAPAVVARRFAPGQGDDMLQLLRLRSLDGAPCLLEQIWLPLPEFQALADGATADWGDLLYPAYAERCGVQVQRAVDEISFAPLSAAQARPLGLAAGHPAAVVSRSAFDLAGRCVEHRITRGDAHAFHYSVTLT
jgi:GntR family transcriptional regulator